MLGVTDAPSVFKECTNWIFHKFRDEFVVVVLDDLLVCSKSEEDHAESLMVMLSVLEKKQLYAELSVWRYFG